MPEEERDWIYAVFLAVDSEELIGIGDGCVRFTHRSGFQMTEFPCEKLWQGGWHDLLAAISDGAFSTRSHTVQHLDRLFFIRVRADSIDHARSAADLLALVTAREGRWYAVIADSPLHAWVHVRDHEHESRDARTCPECLVRIAGRFDEAVEAVALAKTASS